MRVSIVINTYNRASQLNDCLRSLQNLEYDEFEVVVVNGPSTDSTKELCERYSDQIIYVDCSERNLSVSRNLGIANSRGEIVAFIDDDAVVHPKWLEKTVEKYSSDKIVAVGGFTIDHTGKCFQATTTLCNRLGDAQIIPSGISPEVFCFPGTMFFPSLLGTNSTFRKKALENIGGFDETFAYFLDETDVCLRLVDQGGQIIYAPDALIYHRYAPSHLRNSNKVPSSLHVTARSKSYFMHRHGVPALGVRQVNAALSEYERGLHESNKWLCEHGLLNNSAEAMLNLDIEIGIEEGRNLAQKSAPTNLKNHLETIAKRPFKQFPSTAKTKKLRIALVSQGYPPNDTSGIARWTHHVARGLSDRGHRVHVITRSKNNETLDYQDGVWIHKICMLDIQEFEELIVGLDLPNNLVKWSVNVFRELREIGFENLDLISAPIWDVEGIVPLLLSPIPVITSLHTTYKLALPYKPDWYQRPLYKYGHVDKVINAEKFIFEHCSYFLGNTQAVVKEINTEYKANITQRSIVVPHGVDRPESIVLSKSSDAKVLFVGRQETRKGFDTAIKAACKICSNIDKVTFRFIGSETNDSQCKAVLKECLATLSSTESNRISIEGYVTEDALNKAYQECDIFLAPSRFESFGLIAIEAMRYGKPVIAGNVGGLVEVVKHYETGILVDPSNADDISQAILSLLNDKKLAKRLGKAAEQEYQEHFTIEHMVDGIENAYLNFIGSATKQLVLGG